MIVVFSNCSSSPGNDRTENLHVDDVQLSGSIVQFCCHSTAEHLASADAVIDRTRHRGHGRISPAYISAAEPSGTDLMTGECNDPKK